MVHREFPEQGLSVRRPETLRGWLRPYAAATATTASYTTLLDSATPGQSDKPARSTVTAYRDVLDQLWSLDSVPAWSPQNAPFHRLGRSPKHFLADPALALTLLDLTAQDLLRPGGAVPATERTSPMIGPLFEHLVALSVQTYAQAAEGRVRHFRSLDGGHEVDLVVEKGSRVVAIETKLAAEVTPADVRHLRWLADRLGDRVSPVVVSTGRHAYRRQDGILVVPAALLGP